MDYKKYIVRRQEVERLDIEVPRLKAQELLRSMGPDWRIIRTLPVRKGTNIRIRYFYSIQIERIVNG